MDATKRARLFLAGSAAGFLPAFALPLLLDPYGWARRFGWRQDEPETDVGLYFGRCLGALATALVGRALWAARDPEEHPELFPLIETTSWLLVAVHARRAIEGRQPPIEHAEIAGYAAVAVLARRCAP